MNSDMLFMIVSLVSKFELEGMKCKGNLLENSVEKKNSQAPVKTEQRDR